jgi:nanoRNase/pAp phosphatase (c-di-AMP/oligoRNAs hydrolase)
VDVNALAAVFGGGGHKMASGATLYGSLKSIVARVVSEAARRCP